MKKTALLLLLALAVLVLLNGCCMNCYPTYPTVTPQQNLIVTAGKCLGNNLYKWSINWSIYRLPDQTNGYYPWSTLQSGNICLDY